MTLTYLFTQFPVSRIVFVSHSTKLYWQSTRTTGRLPDFGIRPSYSHWESVLKKVRTTGIQADKQICDGVSFRPTITEGRHVTILLQLRMTETRSVTTCRQILWRSCFRIPDVSRLSTIVLDQVTSPCNVTSQVTNTVHSKDIADHCYIRMPRASICSSMFWHFLLTSLRAFNWLSNVRSICTAGSP